MALLETKEQGGQEEPRIHQERLSDHLERSPLFFFSFLLHTFLPALASASGCAVKASWDGLDPGCISRRQLCSHILALSIASPPSIADQRGTPLSAPRLQGRVRHLALFFVPRSRVPLPWKQMLRSLLFFLTDVLHEAFGNIGVLSRMNQPHFATELVRKGSSKLLFFFFFNSISSPYIMP